MARLHRDEEQREGTITPEGSESEGDNNGGRNIEADPEDHDPYEIEEPSDETNSEKESSLEEESYEAEESPDDDPSEQSSISERSAIELEAYNVQEEDTIINKYKQNKNNNYQIPKYYSSDEPDSEDERLREKLEKKRRMRRLNNENKNEYTHNNQIAKQNNTLDTINTLHNKNNKIYPVRYNDDGINKTATYYSTLDQPDVKGQAKLTLHRTKNSEGFHFEAETQIAEGSQPRMMRNGEERQRRLKQSDNIPLVEEPDDLPVITMGALYVEENEDNYETEDRNNNYLIDPNIIDLTEEGIDLETVGMKKTNKEVRWSDTIDETKNIYLTRVRDSLPEIKIINVRGGNGEEQAGEKKYLADGASAEMPGGSNHVKTDTAGRPSILRELLTRASREDVHSKKKEEEALDLKNKQKLKEIKRQKVKADIISNTIKVINEKNKEKQIIDKVNQIKWKNIMTLVHTRNINLTQEENSSTKKEGSESDISSGETVSMHSGTDSQYERISPDMLSEREEKDVNTNNRLIIKDNKMIVTQNDYQTEEENTYPDERPDESRKKNFNIQQDEREKTAAEEKRPMEEDDTDKTYKKQRINRNDKIKIENKLTDYYEEIRSRLKQYQEYFIKRHEKLIEAIATIKDNEITHQTKENNIRKKMNIPKTINYRRTDRIDGVRSDDQSASTAVGDETTHDLDNRIIRDTSLTVRRSLDERGEGHALLISQGDNEIEKMEREEGRLLRLLKEKVRRREREIVRRKARIEHIEQLIDSLPESDEIPSEEERQIENEIDEVQRMINDRSEARTRFRVTEEIYDDYDREVATFDATINFRTDPTCMRADKQTVMVNMFVKNRELRIEKKLLGDVDMENIHRTQYKIPMLKLTKTTGETQPRRDKTKIVEKATGEEEARKGVGKDTIMRNELGREASVATAIARDFDVEDTSGDLSTHGEEETTETPEKSTPEMQTQERKRPRPNYNVNDNEKETKPKKKRTRKQTRKSSGGSSKPKTKAKDGRKLADVTNRVRDSRGRLLGYKPGMESERVLQKRRSPTNEQEETVLTEEKTPRKRPKMKMPTMVPPRATLELQVAVRKLIVNKDSAVLPTPELPLDILQDAGAERARRMRPTISAPVLELSAKRIPEAREEESRSQSDPGVQTAAQRPTEEEEIVPLTQTHPEDVQRGPTATDEQPTASGGERQSPGGGHQQSGQLGSQAEQVE